MLNADCGMLIASLVPKLQLGNQLAAGGGRARAVPKLELGNQVDITFLSVNSGRRYGGLLKLKC